MAKELIRVNVEIRSMKVNGVFRPIHYRAHGAISTDTGEVQRVTIEGSITDDASKYAQLMDEVVTRLRTEQQAS